MNRPSCGGSRLLVYYPALNASNQFQEVRVPLPPPPSTGIGYGLRRAAAAWWLWLLFFTSRFTPWLVSSVKPLFVRSTVFFSPLIRGNTDANARRILDPLITHAESLRYARGVVANFYDFVHDVGRFAAMNRAQLKEQIESVQGTEHYLAGRALRKGAIVLTAHMGSFEAGMVGLVERETRVHVVFKRDNFSAFERIRQDMRTRMGVLEAPVDEGWTVWMRLRDALANDEVVVAQGDRVMPGQKGVAVPFLGGRLLLPTGPIKLAIATGAPIVPIFSVRQPDGRIRVCIEPAITVEHAPGGADPIEAALTRIAAVLAKYVRAYPEQWLALHKVFVEDATTT